MTEDKIEEFLIDSNMLVYAFDSSEKEKHEKAKNFFKSIERNKANLSIQNLVEFHNVVTSKIEKPISLDISKKSVSNLAESFNVFQYDSETIVEAIDLQKENKIHFWDALLAATMKVNGIKIIYTENTKDFEKIKEIKALNPLK